jgi:hypothetical protein
MSAGESPTVIRLRLRARSLPEVNLLQNDTIMQLSLIRRAQLAVQLAISRTVIESSDWFFLPVASIKFSTAVDSTGVRSVDRQSVSFSSNLVSHFLSPEDQHGFSRASQLCVIVFFFRSRDKPISSTRSPNSSKRDCFEF